MLLPLLTGLVGLAVALAVPQATAQPAEERPGMQIPRLPGTESTLAPEEMRRLQDIARQISEQAQNSLRNATPGQEAIATNARRRINGIADEGLAKERDEVLRFLGLEPESSTALYVFVSWSMPLEMLRAYAVEAMWAGATLVFKGIPRGRSLAEYVRGDLIKLVYGKGAAASISIDPRLFDAYEVSVVPSIVLTEDSDAVQCLGRQKQAKDVPGDSSTREIVYQVCEPAPADTYHKMSGAVTLDYALGEFHKAGSDSAARHLRALAKAYAGGAPRKKHIEPYRGEWRDAISPSEIMAARAAAEAAEAAAKQVR